MRDTYKDHILKILSENGPLGVNALQKEMVKEGLDIPLSTLQRYLHRQEYFLLNGSKKWVLPENITPVLTNTSADRAVEALESSLRLIQSQMEELQLVVRNTLSPISTIKRGIKELRPAVAEVAEGQRVVDPRLHKLNDTRGVLLDIMRKKKENIPEEYQDLFFNFDYVGLVIKEGENYTRDFLEADIYDILSGIKTELDEDTITILKENQLD